MARFLPLTLIAVTLLALAPAALAGQRQEPMNWGLEAVWHNAEYDLDPDAPLLDLECDNDRFLGFIHLTGESDRAQSQPVLDIYVGAGIGTLEHQARLPNGTRMVIDYDKGLAIAGGLQAMVGSDQQRGFQLFSDFSIYWQRNDVDGAGDEAKLLEWRTAVWAARPMGPIVPALGVEYIDQNLEIDLDAMGIDADLENNVGYFGILTWNIGQNLALRGEWHAGAHDRLVVSVAASF